VGIRSAISVALLCAVLCVAGVGDFAGETTFSKHHKDAI